MSKKGKKGQRPERFTPIEGHLRQGPVLRPPLAAIKNVHLASWMENRLPELLWAVLLFGTLDRTLALAIIRHLGDLIFTKAQATPSKSMVIGVTHSDLAAQTLEERCEIIERLTDSEAARTALRPLGLLQSLPAAADWRRFLPSPVEGEDWNLMERAVARSLFHQSQEATDCRWVSVLWLLLSGRLKGLDEESLRMITEYPTFGEMTKVRPFIRSSEGAISGMGAEGAPAQPWSRIFWDTCLASTKCIAAPDLPAMPVPAGGTTIGQIDLVTQAVIRHWAKTQTSASLDVRKEAAFGFALYSLAILSELTRLGQSTTILARSGLRTLLECYITLAYLKHSNSDDLWLTYRRYGSGRAKLAFLKLQDTSVGYVDPASIEGLASEDLWQEFLDIDLGHWAKLDLRSMSTASGTKDDYDRFQDWPSGFIHAQWAAVRETSFATCLNALHKLHRVPRSTPRALGDVVADACYLADKTLSLLDQIFPGIPERVTVEPAGPSRK